MTQPEHPILTVENLSVSFTGGASDEPGVRAIRGVSLTLYPRQTLAVVGESGSGKSVTALSVLRLLPSPPARVEGGRVLLRDQAGAERDLLTLSATRLRAVRGGDVAMIFQEPMTSLNPVYTIGEQIIEAVRIHQRADRNGARAAAIAALSEVGIPRAAERLDAYPHQFSGGMRQRVMIAIALACRPRVLLADEPTTALDVTVQAQILELLRTLQHHRGLAVMLITHALGIVAQNADAVAVMYGGRVVEYAVVTELFTRPLHPYTRGLLASIPHTRKRVDRLFTVRELVQDESEFQRLGPGLRPWWPEHPPPADVSGNDSAALVEVRPKHWVALWRTPQAALLPGGIPSISARRAAPSQAASSNSYPACGAGFPHQRAT